MIGLNSPADFSYPTNAEDTILIDDYRQAFQ